ncbi:GMP synthase, large subunit [Methanococcus vannielii SB]|jgi:GMP synthase (glutamine-hydrolysing)|uniref:GMP synthase [glutamine-hydrolyzing] subunit B n=1 Tax=Methanococcus vannielii (strain ATCC 35089 / DSM 1224 / JCM 13029 / OCM 148 / SB) TaxID=406327 RepID=GUAAB_METVS|nr:glutamine-hydrolyzing GMP synthase [Methanococcus vannielii]A6UN70.1 RecName: Full=GMP synthase [glutamine-hydrolyzing] subunit B; AltName: Full=GMP synthetase [Methanococcus vannielii SB]ABR53942.1 GMP synthase, large subunit [Methanococcus vannielii SB]
MFDAKSFIEESVEDIKKQINGRKTIIALSGGVDSSVAAVLTGKAIGDQLLAVYVDTGLMRKNESNEIWNIFKEQMGLNLKIVEAKDLFLSELAGIDDPEQKRKIIGRIFIEVFEKVAKEQGEEILVQGTIAPDWIESEGQIKTHHNIALPSGMVLEVVEPLRDLYKDEVRKLATELGLPEKIAHRQPFPGPGLAVRILGEITEEKLEICKEANFIVSEEIEKTGLQKELWQYFAAVLDTKATGVKGDIRDYNWVVALRFVKSLDAMTAHTPEIPFDLIKRISKRITSEIPNVTRVVLDVTDKPPATIEFE